MKKKNLLNFTSSFKLSFILLLILIFYLILFLPLIAYSMDDLAILKNIIDTEKEDKLLAIVNKWINSSDELANLYLGIAYHNLALIDSIKYAEKAVSYFNNYKGIKFLSIATGYKGSAITLVANSFSKKGNLMAAASKLTEGFELLDKAIKMDPENIIIRFLRAENGIEITETTPFNRSKVVEEDLNFLNTNLNTFTSLEKAQYYLILARLKIFQKKISEAIFALKQVIKEAPDSKYAKKARQLLTKLED